MKQVLSLLFLMNIWFIVHGQSSKLEEYLAQLSDQPEGIELGKMQYLQQFIYDSSTPFRVVFRQEKIDRKGKSSTMEYEFNPGLLKSSMIRIVSTSKEMKLVLNARKDIIGTFKDGEWDGYQSEIEIYCQDITASKELEKIFKDTVSEAQKEWKNTVSLPTEIEQLSEWLSDRIGSFNSKRENVSQEWLHDDDKLDMVNITTVNEDEETNQMSYSLADINPKSIAYDVKGDNIIVEARTKKKENYILVTDEKGELSYENEFAFFSESPSQATMIVMALQKIVPMCDSLLNTRLHKPNDIMEAFTMLETILIAHSFNEFNFSQSIIANCESSYTLEVADDKKTINQVYSFNWGDLNSKTDKIVTDKLGVAVELTTEKKRNYIELFEEDSFKGFKNEIQFRVPSIETAKHFMILLDTLSQNCELDYSSQDLKWLNESLSNIYKIEEDINQEITSTEDCQLVYTLTETGKSDDIDRYEFDLSTVDLNKLELEIDSKSIELEIQTRGGEKSINHYDEDNDLSYEDDFKMYFSSVKEGRIALLTLKEMVAACKE